jgi:transcriptional regulator with XRE-family HTH domain
MSATTVTPNGGRIRELRENLGLTQVRLAARIGRSQKYISTLENGQRTTRLSLRAVALALGEPVQEIAAPLRKAA